VDMISFGLVYLELVFGQLDALPGPGEEVFTDEFAISCGGAVTSATAAAAGGAKAGVCTRLGDDLGSQVAIEHCAEVGVDLSTSARIAGPTAGITVVLNFAGDRGFVTHVPPRLGHEPPELDRWLAVLRAERPAWCYVHAGRGMPRFLRAARELGCQVMLDISLGDEREGDVIIECIELADIFVPNSDELFRLTGAATFEDAVRTASQWGTQLVVTRGAAGAVYSRSDGSFTEVTKGVAPVKVRDLTGAGDNFAGALIAALVGGATLADAVIEGNVAGCRAVGQLGAIGQIGAGSGGWPLQPMILNHGLAGAMSGTGSREILERG
jgi:sugar/nucleoside kinase (ribokinase family)